MSPGYGLGVMHGSIDGGYSLCGHTGCGPGSVIAVYHVRHGDFSACCAVFEAGASEGARSEEHTSELQSLMRISYAVFCLTKKNQQNPHQPAHKFIHY